VIAWRGLTGGLPFSADSPITLLAKIAFEAPEMAGATSAVTRIFERVFAKAPGHRFASSLEFASALDVALSHVEPVPVVAVNRPLPPEERKSPLPWIVVAIVVVVFAAVAAIIFMRPPRDAAPAVKTAPAPEIVPAPPPPEKAAKPKLKAVKKAAVAKDTTPEAPKLKPIEPKVVHQ